MNAKREHLGLIFGIFLLCAAVWHDAYGLSVKLAQPRNGARFERCADIRLLAEADIADTDIKRIIFYRDGQIAKALRAAPWEFTMEIVPDGIYEVCAKLTDNNNVSVSSDTIQIFVGPIEDGDKLKNGEFACGLSPWQLVLTENAAATLEIDPEGWLSAEASMAVINIDNPGAQNWHVMLMQPCPIDSGHTYEIYFAAEVEVSKTIGVDFQSTTGDYPVHFWQSVPLTNDTFEYGPIEFFCPVTDPSNQFKLAISENSQSIFFDAIRVIDKNWVKNETAVDEKTIAVELGYELQQNYPNPFNPSTEIRFELPQTTWINLSIYNVHGQLVKTLVNTIKSAGSHAVLWDGRDEKGLTVPSGVYIYKMTTEKLERSRRMLLIK